MERSRSEEVRAAQKAYKLDMETEHKRIGEQLEAMFELANNGICPECKQPMIQVQRGKCVYASPCNHRLWQGKANRIT